MLHAIKNFLGIGPQVDLGELIRNGATILDVRTKGEYAQGHVTGSVNIPLDQLSGQLSRMKKDKDHPVITCCASGMRSASAKRYLISQGYTHVHNGGGWHNLKQYEK